MRLFFGLIDKTFAGTCAGIGLYFAWARNRSEALRVFNQRATEEKRFSEEANWEVTEVKEIDPKMSLAAFLQENPEYFLLKPEKG